MDTYYEFTDMDGNVIDTGKRINDARFSFMFSGIRKGIIDLRYNGETIERMYYVDGKIFEMLGYETHIYE